MRRLIALSGLLITLSACGLLPSTQPDQSGDYEKRAYVGVAGAATRLNPMTDGSAFELSGSGSTGAVATVGLDVGRRAAIELTAADLGSASLTPIATAGPAVVTQELSYTSVAGSVIYYGLGVRHQIEQRRGLAGYGRLGVNQTSSSSDIALDSADEMQLFAGLGAEYMLGQSTSVRAEYIGYDGDASAAQLGILYRFGSPRSVPTAPIQGPLVGNDSVGNESVGNESDNGSVDAPADVVQDSSTSVAAAPDEPVTPSLPGTVAETSQPHGVTPEAKSIPGHNNPVQTAEAAQTQVNASQAQGVGTPDAVATVAPSKPLLEDSAEPSESEVTESDVTVVGSAPVQTDYDGVLRGVVFAAGTSDLTPTAKRILQRLALQLQRDSQTRLEIRTHTDASLEPALAMTLTRQRAVAIARVLINAGVSKRQLAARAFGSNSPRADNNTAGGRRLNNRVELKEL